MQNQWEQFLELAWPYKIKVSYLFVVNQTPGSVSGLVRISLSGEIQDEIVSLGTITYFSHRVFAGNSYILVNKRYLYRVDGNVLTLIFYFDSNVAISQYKKHLEGKADFSREIWKWINLELWYEKYIT